uniref:Glutamyl-tRNA(Gln) amidotransferase subunit A n=1 Tax=Ignisphaera aggregans TaxID=334771 RepID=A0A7C4NL89_9CREN
MYKLVEVFENDPNLVVEYINKLYDRISSIEDKIKAYITLRRLNDIISEAENLLKIRKKSCKKMRLFGIAIAVKDNISTKGIRTTCASRMLENYVPPFDATVITKLKDEGAIIIGKTNMDEFAMGSTTETSAFYPSRNPWDSTRSPGGSSGGSAAALAAGEATVALGSDTGGSIRNPAAFTATFGLKPTYGLVSRYGLIAYASSLDQIGPMARNSDDLALLLNVIAGYDSKDSTSIDIAVPDFYKSMYDLFYKEPRLRIGIAKELFEESDELVKKTAYQAVDTLCSYHECNEVSIPYAKQSVAAYYIIAMAEASSNLARYDGVRYGLKVDFENKSWIDVYRDIRTMGYGYEVKKRVALGAYVLSMGYWDMYYLRALKFRRMLKEEFNRIFHQYNVIVSPTMPILPPKLGEFLEDPIKMYYADVNTITANLIGAPAISAPAGFVNGLPVGLQIMARYFDEITILYLSKFIEESIKLRDLIAPV